MPHSQNNENIFKRLQKKFNFRTTLTRNVALPGLLLMFALSLYCGIFPGKAERVLSFVQSYIYDNLSWVYVLVIGAIFIFLIVLAFSKIGNIRLGADDSRPQYSFFAWISMLFAAGMGIGLMYFGVAEPMSHYVHPAFPDTISRAKDAQLYTFFHWGFHAWAIYAVIGLVLAYFSFRHNLPLALRSGLYPILKDKINGPIGDCVDVFALCSTFFGVATSLGFGVVQLNAGLEYLGILPESALKYQIIICAVVISLAICSSVSGVNKGIKYLSEINIWLAVILMLFILFLGPTIYLFNAFSEGIGYYLSNIVGLTFNTYAFETSGKDLFSNWTVMYWAWWIAWAPFVGLFIARISKGRTIREYILAVLIIPSLFIFLWMTVFGNGAIWVDSHIAGGVLSKLADNPDILLFKFLDYFPMTNFIYVIVVLMIAIFFITSADSGILVMNGIASTAKGKHPNWQKVFWGVLLCILSSVLLRTGGLGALQTMTLITALPFALIMIVLCYCLLKAVQLDNVFVNTSLPYGSDRWTGEKWKDRLQQIVSFSDVHDVREYIRDTVLPAFNELQKALAEQDIEAEIHTGKTRKNMPYAELLIRHDMVRNFKYGVKGVSRKVSDMILEEDNMPNIDSDKTISPITYFNDERVGYNICFLGKEEVIADILKEYERFIIVISNEKNRLLVLDKLFWDKKGEKKR